MISKDHDNDEATAGVLLVHGIGQQRPGETLAQGCDALVSWFARWTEPAFERNLDSDSELVARIDQADFAPTDGGPAHAYLTVRIPGRAEPVRLHLAESRWAESFCVPSFREVVTWGLVVTPWAIMCHFGKRAAFAAFRILDKEKVGRPVALAVLGAVLRLLVLTVALLVVAPIVLTWELALLILGLAPISSVRTFVIQQQRVLVATVGDSTVFLRSPTQEAAIVGKVQRDLNWLIEKSKLHSVLVLAHSQGAAVSHEALRRAMPREVSGFVTFGSGLSVLSELKTGETTAALIPYLALCGAGLGILWAIFGFPRPVALLAPFWLVLGPSLVALAVVGMLAPVLENYLRYGVLFRLEETHERRTSWELSPTAERTKKVGFFGFLAILGAILATLPWGLLLIPAWIFVIAGLQHPAVNVLTRDYLLSKRQLSGAFQWTDFFASADPVSNGPFRDFKDRKELANRRYPSSTVEVHNRASWLFDHIIYWTNTDQFVTAIAREIGRVGQFDLEVIVGDHWWIEVARKRREWRVGWLRAAKIAALALALAVLFPSLWSTDMARYFGDVLARGIELATRWGFLAEANAKHLPELRSSGSTFITRALPVLLVLGAYGIVWAIWLCWNQSEIAHFFNRGKRGKRWAGYTGCPPWFGVFAVTFAAFAFGGLWLIARSYFVAEPSKTAVAIVLAILAAGLLFFWRSFVMRFLSASCSGPLPIAFASASGPDTIEMEAVFRTRADQIARDLARLHRIEADTQKRADLTAGARNWRLEQLGEQWQALAHECSILLNTCTAESTRIHVKRAAEMLLNSVGSKNVPEKRLKYFRERFQTAVSGASVGT